MGKTTPKSKTVKNVKNKKTMKTKKSAFSWRKVITIAICIAIPLCIGFISAGITGDAMKKFGQFNQPPLAPPAWLFPVAWTILYVLMGIASYFIFIYKPRTKKEKKFRIAALVLYCAQLVLNFVWTPIFFLAGDFIFALAVLLIMWLMLIIAMFLIRERSMPAMWCLLPYALWCLFAMYLNVGILLLN